MKGVPLNKKKKGNFLDKNYNNSLMRCDLVNKKNFMWLSLLKVIENNLKCFKKTKNR